MTKLLIAILVLLFMGIPFANAEQVYYCTSELATGIIKDEKTGKWKESSFESQRLTIKFNDDYSKLDGMDDYSGSWKCQTSAESTTHQGILLCSANLLTGFNFSFETKTLRFLLSLTRVHGYVNNGDDTNVIIAGTCKKF